MLLYFSFRFTSYVSFVKATVGECLRTSCPCFSEALLLVCGGSHTHTLSLCGDESGLGVSQLDAWAGWWLICKANVRSGMLYLRIHRPKYMNELPVIIISAWMFIVLFAEDGYMLMDTELWWWDAQWCTLTSDVTQTIREEIRHHNNVWNKEGFLTLDEVHRAVKVSLLLEWPLDGKTDQQELSRRERKNDGG